MKKMLQSILLNKTQVHNRLVLPPMATSKCSEDGKVNQELLDYYNEKSNGGYIGLIIIEHSFISREGKAGKGQISIADDSVVESLKDLAKIIQNNGSKAVMQISHAGSATNKDITGLDPVGPSAVSNKRTGNVPKELSEDEIQMIINHFHDAALRVKQAGFDGVEIHGAHGFLLNQFFSPLSNIRRDEYGGDLSNRLNILLKVVKAVRKAVGNEYPVMLRLGACDFTEGGTTIEDGIAAAIQLEKAGVDMLDISGGLCGSSVHGLNEEGYFWPLTKAIKEAVNIPVMLTGGITEIQSAERLLSEGKADLIGVGRAMLKDSNWAKDAIES